MIMWKDKAEKFCKEVKIGDFLRMKIDRTADYNGKKSFKYYDHKKYSSNEELENIKDSVEESNPKIRSKIEVNVEIRTKPGTISRKPKRKLISRKRS